MVDNGESITGRWWFQLLRKTSISWDDEFPRYGQINMFQTNNQQWDTQWVSSNLEKWTCSKGLFCWWTYPFWPAQPAICIILGKSHDSPGLSHAFPMSFPRIFPSPGGPRGAPAPRPGWGSAPGRRRPRGGPATAARPAAWRAPWKCLRRWFHGDLRGDGEIMESLKSINVIDGCPRNHLKMGFMSQVFPVEYTMEQIHWWFELMWNIPRNWWFSMDGFTI